MYDQMDVMDSMDSLDKYKGKDKPSLEGNATLNVTQVAQINQTSKVDLKTNETNEQEGPDPGSDASLQTSIKTGDITTFDFDIYKYKRPSNYFQSKDEEQVVTQYLESEDTIYLQSQHRVRENQRRLEANI